ncbi:MAG: TrkA family potassium uptake protein, partial [Bacteroidales bacterium]|nr:TrkA family potassium uptake protein [Bacteroidales bacterium]
IILVLFLGWTMFFLASKIYEFSAAFLETPIHIEAILIGIIASFYIANYTKFRETFEHLIRRFGHYIYAAFFTLIGATLSLDLLLKYWVVAILLFGIRTFSIFTASVIGSMILKKSKKEIFLSWTPYITQAGVSLGLITIVSAHFLNFGDEFEAVLIAVIIINQFIGPPLMKSAIIRIGEAHIKSKEHETDFHKDVFILGIGGKAVMLARTLKREGYAVQIVTDKSNVDTSACKVKVNLVEEINSKILSNLNFASADSVVIFRTEDVAFEISELIYEHFGTPNIIVVLETHTDILRFQEIGVTVVAPTAALIALLEHYVRSPQATSILLGMQEARETEDIEVLADDIHARALRDLQFPVGILILSVTRNGEIILPKGYTRLRKHDIVTVVGSQEQIDLVRTKLQF